MSPVETPKARPPLSLGARVDTVLGRFTMYRLVLLVLAVLAVYSLVLDALGWLAFGIPEMLAHLGLCLGLTYASNRGLAALFRVRPHTESSLITGLLLYFLFWPSFATLDVAGVALACVLASASKYALAWRGRHVFNPAAAGAFITGLTGLNIATWWAATPAMLWLLVPGVLLVLYRTRKLLMAAVFLVVAAAIITAELLEAGMSVDMALWQSFAQRPLLFFVGFMLTEPLTLPPRRWQQLALAGVVGVVFALPYNFGFLTNSPEAALLLGNLLAFLVGQRGRVTLRLAGTRRLTPSATEFSFEPSRKVRFVPGQYMELDLPQVRADRKGRRRVFSLTGSPDERLIRFGVRTAGPVSAAKRVLLGLQPGDEVAVTSVGGDFVLPRDPRKPVLLIAAGIGITPYLSHVSSGSLRERDAVLLLLARSADEVAYAEELRTAGIPVLVFLADGSTPPADLGVASWDRGRLDGEALRTLVPDIAKREVFISGSPASVASLRRAARQAGAKRVHVDSFSGY
ncbi:ferredoxin--NADP reductase [Pseudarthrobacter sp. NamB4]|uniref:ferredoxin--NADP reductase n=1 Tax=Pseudarthrobacter sp. NamB4 TaxID=2576837 RepID=UPI0010FD9586|nr:FAD-dependent oxidoreductase [Pseudarthrobacter sp. NamB4]TLM76008.1 oxidoreductase [Pseudarthrobacter sp. NamB4]